MSFVGPRPALFNQHDLIELRTQQGVHALVPGLTGWAQVNGRDELRAGPVSLPLVANVLFGPSYVSLDFALSWHALIPEGVVEVSSVTPRRTREFVTPVGRFSYTHLPLAVYGMGVW